MISIDRLGLAASTGERLGQSDYKRDFRQRFQALDGQGMWKLERRQHFRESGVPSWEAFVRGDWSEALRLYERRRAELAALTEDKRRRRIDSRRVRVVELPIAPYVQWELNAFRVRVESGDQIRVVGPEKLRDLEHGGPLPELINLGGDTLYEIRYDEQGVADGAIRYTDPGLVERYRQLWRELYEAGEDLLTFFDREVAHLPPPPPAG
ncbi:DUF6879 family protein [Streptomyces sp. 4N509B]|uniref:DUF6879 family protein n=1 Tax=Streptomyces sp. 4N509B TaxID=3457413 RepID=UPI003FD5A4BB